LHNPFLRCTAGRTLTFLLCDVVLGLAVSGTVLGDGNLGRSAPLLVAVVVSMLYCTYSSIKKPEYVSIAPVLALQGTRLWVECAAKRACYLAARVVRF